MGKLIKGNVLFFMLGVLAALAVTVLTNQKTLPKSKETNVPMSYRTEVANGSIYQFNTHTGQGWWLTYARGHADRIWVRLPPLPRE